jgi:hypothetical protein
MSRGNPLGRPESLQHLRAGQFLIECPFDRFDLAADSPYANDQLLFVPNGIGADPTSRDAAADARVPARELTLTEPDHVLANARTQSSRPR